MGGVPLGMKDRDFNHLLNRLREERLPPCPPTLARDVLRRIRNGTVLADGAQGSFIGEVLQMAFRPQMAALLLAMAVLMGTVTTAVAGHLTPAAAPKTIDTLGFEVIKNSHYLECYHPTPPPLH